MSQSFALCRCWQLSDQTSAGMPSPDHCCPLSVSQHSHPTHSDQLPYKTHKMQQSTTCMTQTCSNWISLPRHCSLILVYHLVTRRSSSSKIQNEILAAITASAAVKGKSFPYSLPSVEPRADASVQAVIPQVTIIHPPGGRLPLLSARPVVTFLAAQHHYPLAGTTLYCLVTEAHRCEQLAQGCDAALPRVGFKPTTCWSQVQSSTRCATTPPVAVPTSKRWLKSRFLKSAGHSLT